MTGKESPTKASRWARLRAIWLTGLAFLPPANANERVVGDMTRMVAGGGGMLGAANKVAQLPGRVGQVGSFMAQNPVNQLVSAAGAGGAAGASREAGARLRCKRLLGCLVGSLRLLLWLGWKRIGQSAADAVTKMAAPQVVQQRVDNQINLTLRRAGVDWAGLDSSVKAQVRQDVANALQDRRRVERRCFAPPGRVPQGRRYAYRWIYLT